MKKGFGLIKKKGNRQVGIVIIILSLLMILSLLLLSFLANPFYIVQASILIPLFGETQTLLIWVFITLFATIHYMGMNIPSLTFKRMIGIVSISFATYWFANNWVIMSQHDVFFVEDSSLFIKFYSLSFLEHMKNIFSADVLQMSTNTISSWFINTGFLLPIIFFITSVWCYGIIGGILFLSMILYWVYVIYFGEFQIYLAKLQFWKNDDKNIEIRKEVDSLDLNVETKEFELNFTKEEKEKIDLIQRVRKNMDTKNYEELSEKIRKEKEKIINLKSKILIKTKEKQAEYDVKSKLSDKNKEELMAALGQTYYSQIKGKPKKLKLSDIQFKEIFSPEKENNEQKDILIKKGFQTTEEAYDLSEKDLSDSFIEEIINEHYKNLDQTQEVPLIKDYYADIFENDDILEKEIQKTLETNLDFDKKTTKIIIENIQQDITVEEYLSIPDEITSLEEKRHEKILNIIAKTQNSFITPITKDAEDYIKDDQEKEETHESTLNIKVEKPNSLTFSITEDTEDHTQDDQEKEETHESTLNIKVEKPNSLTSSITEDTEDHIQDDQEKEETHESTLNIKVEKPNSFASRPIKDAEDYVWDEEEEETLEEEIKIRPEDWCKPFTLPSTSILSSVTTHFNNSQLVEESTQKADKINNVFSSFNINASVNSFDIGPTITTFKIELDSGIKTTKVTNLEDNLKLNLGAEYIRIIAPIPGTSFIGIEVPNSIKKPVLFKSVFDDSSIKDEGIQISIGQDVSGKPLSFDLAKAPHLLVAGSTGSGKSVAINTILASIIFRYKPTDVQLILIDPKMVEFAPFHGIPHLLAEVITDATNANSALKAMVDEMERRYKLMAENGVKKIDELNVKFISENKNKLPYIVIIIDELADLMMVAAKEVEESIMRITQKARAAGIHMVVATQRPSTEIITGTIKSNIPSRMAFTVASSIDSRTILGQIGAEKLIGMGDMLISLYGQLPVRGQGAYISNTEIDELTAFVKTQCDAYYMIDVEKFSASLNIVNAGLISLTDPMYIAAKDTVVHYQKASTSMIQRHLNIGYNKAANIIETLESEGIIGKSKGSRPREVLIEE